MSVWPTKSCHDKDHGMSRRRNPLVGFTSFPYYRHQSLTYKMHSISCFWNDTLALFGWIWFLISLSSFSDRWPQSKTVFTNVIFLYLRSSQFLHTKFFTNSKSIITALKSTHSKDELVRKLCLQMTWAPRAWALLNTYRTSICRMPLKIFAPTASREMTNATG